MEREVDITSPMSRAERRGSMALASIFALRMFGLFMILPVLSVLAENLEASTPVLIGLAISAYGLTQALFQIPFGLLSDRLGRKPVIVAGLAIFAAGSAVCALSDSLYGIIAGRALQGSGAIAAAAMALAADLTREVHRTKAMAMIGISIGMSFAVSLVAGPVLAGIWGLSGLFWVTSVFALVAIAVLLLVVPNPGAPRFHRDAEAAPEQFRAVLADSELVRLDFGIFALHLILTASFVVVPLLLREASLPVVDHWIVYLPVLLVSMLAIVPFIIVAEKKRKIRQVFLGAITIVLAGTAGLAMLHDGVVTIAAFLFLFFCGFNLLEATLPSMVSKIAPAILKGTAMGVYSTSQFLGAFAGGTAGGWLYGEFGAAAVLLMCAGVAGVWLGIARSMKNPAHLSSLLLNVGSLDPQQAEQMSARICEVEGVAEAVVLADDGVAYLKVDRSLLDLHGLQRLIPQAADPLAGS